nr:MAG TPA: Baseplate J like protein [Caudoviricetes sp.]
MARPDFIYPDFVEGTSPEEIQQRMMNSLPLDIDGMPGGFPYDFTMPTAIEKSEIINLHLIRTLMLMFPQWAWDEWLDLHGKQCGLPRKQATYASGEITITGEPGIVFPKGFVVCTPATDTASSVLFALDEETTIPAGKNVKAKITAVEAGMESNVSAGMVVIMSKPVDGIASINNESEITGGTDRETDEDYWKRIDEINANQGASFIGNDNDFRRWAKEVDGIGECIITQAWNGPGTVKLSLVDLNGEPANKKLCEAVYEHIISPSDRSARLMATGSAELTVAPADTVTIAYSCKNLTFDGAITSKAQIIKDFKAALAKYYPSAKENRAVKYNQTHALLTAVAGVIDFTDFKVAGGISNVVLAESEYPRTGTVSFTE